MIRWCNYCSTFLGQSEPFNDFRISHGICERCLNEGKLTDFENIKDHPIEQFFVELFNSILKGEQVDPEDIMNRGQAIGLDTSQILLGVLHPILWKIGQYFENGKMSVENEHLFSETVKDLLSKIDGYHDQLESDILFIPVPENRHTFGVKFFGKLIYDKHGITSDEVGSFPVEEGALVDLLETRKPSLLGFSVALPEHFQYVETILRGLDEMGSPLKVVIGGVASKTIVDEVKNLPTSMADRILHISDAFDTFHDLQTISSHIEKIQELRQG